MRLEHKFHRPEAGLTVGEDARVEGYASVFGRRDHGGDVVVRGAYSASLAALSARGGRVKMLWQHDPGQPIGVWDEVREDERGLWVRGRLLTEVARGRETAALIGAGAIDGLSIGYRTRRAERAPEGGRKLVELELWEVSLVTFPMLPDATLGGARKETEAPVMAELAGVFDAARRALAQR
ncbi:HK97 family phage prohead protease [Rhodobacteraceae bacterium WD3A24]|nr:HK97 family phage prohead protease [Rhodobacteraceae bacterium WD3A24]